jgi:transposase-like protein
MVSSRIPYATEQGISKRVSGNFFRVTGNPHRDSKRPLFARLFCACQTRSVLTGLFASEEEQMAAGGSSRERYGEAFWRAHHEAWRQSDLNQREYCEAHGLSLKAFGNWRAKFKAEPQPLPRKLLYRRGVLSHRVSHTLGHSLSHMTNGSPEQPLIVPPARDGHRRSFSEADKRRIVEEARQPGASLSEVARRFGIAARVLFRWKQELKPSAAPMFVTVQIADATAASDAALGEKERAP